VTRWIALWPAAFVGLFVVRLGGFESSTRAAEAAAASALVLLAALLAGRRSLDPLRLGARAAWLVPTLLLVVVASWLTSLTPRAGLLAIVLLPAYLLLPAAVTGSIAGPGRRRLALLAWCVLVAGVAATALWDAGSAGWIRAAMPLGHHSLLGAWLAMALPLAAVPLRERGAPRWLAGAAVALGGVALVATRSLSAGAGLLVALAVTSRRMPRLRDLTAGLLLLGLGLAVPRLERIASGDDLSAAARRSYAESAIAGAAERPWLGWGPGAYPWTAAGFLVPRPGANPPGELVGEPHSTPLRLLYELGAVGALLVAGLLAAFAWARGRERGRWADRDVALAATTGLGAGLIGSLGVSWLAIPALPLTAAVVTGWLLAAGPPREEPGRRWAALVPVALVLLAVGVAWPLHRAQAAYERAASTEVSAERRIALDEAIRLDPRFPLYRARRAWLSREGDPSATRRAARAARLAPGVAPLWLRVGGLALAGGESNPARTAFARALALDPLGAAAPFGMFVASDGRELDCAARALAAEPKLAAALFWRGRMHQRTQAIAMVRRFGDFDPKWRKQFVREALVGPLDDERPYDLVYRIDRTPALSASLHLFRRPAWEGELLRVRLDGAAARRVRIRAATEEAWAPPSAFPRDRCWSVAAGPPG